MKSVTITACAKINLTLDILSRRPDGYHNLRSVMQTVALHDTLVITHSPEEPGVALTVDGEEAGGVPANSENIVHQAAVRLQKVAAARGTLPGNQSGLRIHLTKRIPSQAGLGGGSSDCAAALRAIDFLFDLHLSTERLQEIGASLGADVPFFITGGAALVEGLGERVTPMPPLAPAWHLVIVKPAADMPTPAAFAALDALPERQPGQATDVWLAAAGNACPNNDFEQVIFPMRAEIRAVVQLLSQTTSNGDSFRPTLCGSGAAVFCRVPNAAEGKRLAALIDNKHLGKTWVTKTQGALHEI